MKTVGYKTQSEADMSERAPVPYEEVTRRISDARSQQDYNYWEDYEQSLIDQDMSGLPIDHEGRPKQPRASDSNIERHLDNLSIFTGWLHNPDETATYYRGGVPCYNKNKSG